MIKKIFFLLISVMFINIFMYLFHSNKFHLVQYYTTPFWDHQYEQDQYKIRPYFDEEYYKRTCDKWRDSPLKPIDHFMLQGWRGKNSECCNPNSWFNTALYKERLWPTQKNPFLDFLNQPKQRVDSHKTPIIVYMQPQEIWRAFIAVEALLRTSDHPVILHLSKNDFKMIPLAFQSMIPRGLKVELKDSNSVSFYKSPFLKKPGLLSDTSKYPTKNDSTIPMQWIHDNNQMPYLMHHLYRGTKWYKIGRIDPLVINIAKYTDEPLLFSAFGKTPEEFVKQMKSMAPGFDLLFTGIDIQMPNSKVIPGYMETWINDDDIPNEKEFSVSFLLTLGGKGSDSFSKGNNRNYYIRQEIWDKLNDLQIPNHFYISQRDLKKYPKDMQKFGLPEGKKKWIFKSQFNIVVENSQQCNYFSEKLLGCFWTLTVPIYIGCPNIDQYFDMRGILIAKDALDAIRIANSVTPEMYQKMLPFVKENKMRTAQLLSLKDKYIHQFLKQCE